MRQRVYIYLEIEFKKNLQFLNVITYGAGNLRGYRPIEKKRVCLATVSATDIIEQ